MNGEEDVLKHIGLVRWILKKDFSWTFKMGLGEDLFQQGMIGLIKAVKRYDPTKGMKFSVFGIWYIKMYIRQGLRLYGRDRNVKCTKDFEIPLSDNDLQEYQRTKDDLENKKKVLLYLSCLNGKVRKIDILLLKERFGLAYDGSPPVSYKELSLRHHMSRKTVKSRLEYVLNKLRKIIKKDRM